MTAAAARFPAEWEPQDAVLIAWPHAGTDWAARLAAVETTYVELAAAIARFQTAAICVADVDLQQRAAGLLAARGVDPARLRWLPVAYNDTWLRDSGPISLHAGDGFRLLDFRFTGWGGKYGAELDDALIGACFAGGLFSAACTRQPLDFALEGGAIETDGAGTLLTTWRCLQQRHPDTSREVLSQQLAAALHTDRVLALEYGYLEGDDTDAHIDTLARIAPNDTVVFQACDDVSDSHYLELGRMRAELAALRTRDGRPYRLLPLPWAQPVLDDGRRLAASYANYLVINGAVLLPAYGDPADAAAAAVLAQAYPGREIVPVPCRALIWQNGSLHCVTMQLPRGVLAAG